MDSFYKCYKPKPHVYALCLPMPNFANLLAIRHCIAIISILPGHLKIPFKSNSESRKKVNPLFSPETQPTRLRPTTMISIGLLATRVRKKIRTTTASARTYSSVPLSVFLFLRMGRDTSYQAATTRTQVPRLGHAPYCGYVC